MRTAAKLNSEALVTYALAAKSVLRALKEADAKLTYQQFVEAIGLKEKGLQWRVGYRTQAVDVLDLLEAIEEYAQDEKSDFGRIVNAETGQPGSGFYTHNLRLVEMAKVAKK